MKCKCFPSHFCLNLHKGKEQFDQLLKVIYIHKTNPSTMILVLENHFLNISIIRLKYVD